MVWRIHFTAADLARTRISATLGPLAETIMALSFARCPLQPRLLFSRWRDQIADTLTNPALQPLAALVPPGTKGVDFCTLAGEAPTIDQGIRSLLAIPREQLLAEMEFFDNYHRLPRQVWAVADPGADARLQLGQAAQATYSTLVEPYWNKMQAYLHAEQLSRSRILMGGGVEQLLATLAVRRILWRPPVLELLVPGNRDIELGGRGLRLVPSLFIGDLPALHTDINDPMAAPRLVFPAAHDPASIGLLWDYTRPGGVALGALVGRTRAAALRNIAGGCTTTELAGRVGISLAGASQHATVLRDAGLITSRREGNAVMHTLTPLGIELLAGSTASRPPGSDIPRSDNAGFARS